MILDCQVLEGNPADSTLAKEMVDRQVKIFSRPPRQIVFDGGFASKLNLNDIKAFTRHLHCSPPQVRP
jgi:transposase